MGNQKDMTKSLLTIITAVLTIAVGCKSQDRLVDNISCSGEVTVQYDRIKQSDKDKPKADKDLDALMVYFLSDFNDSIRAYINNKVVFEQQVEIGADSHSLENFFGYNYSEDSSVPILKVESLTRETCFDIPIEKDYKLIYVFLNDDGEWTVRFSNIYYVQ